MTNTEAKLKGIFGEKIRKLTELEIERAVREAVNEATVDENGVIRWNSNGKCPPQDFCELLLARSYRFDIEATKAAREAQEEEFLRNYQPMEISPEMKYEIEAAFGKAQTIIDVFSGKVVYAPER